MDHRETSPALAAADQPATLMALLLPLAQHWVRLLLLPLLVGAVAVGASFWVAPVFTARTTLLPPQQQSAGNAALASLGALAGLMGGGTRSTADQYVALMQSASTADRLIDRFNLMQVYDVDMRWKARRDLGLNVNITVGKKDGLITIDVDDESPQLAADIANHYVEELRLLTNVLAVTEAQQRRVFFESQLQKAKDKLGAAQTALQSSGFNMAALKAEPKAAAEGYAKLQAELTAAEVRLQSLRGALADNTPEVRQMQDTAAALRSQLAKAERVTDTGSIGADYVGKYRDFKYQETLFELMARQYEMARVDESREGALIQVVDAATPPERKSRPKRSLYGIGAALATFLAYAMLLVARSRLREAQQSDPQSYAQWQALKAAFWR